MTTLLLLLAAAYAVYWAWNRPAGARRGPGASAAARARELRTPLVRLATACGIVTRAERQARRFDQGAAGERRAAARLRPLAGSGWWVRWDLALPHGWGRANVDALAISPGGVPYLLDPKVMHSRYPVSVHGGRVWHGRTDVTRRIASAAREATAVSHALAVPVVAIVAIEGGRLVDSKGRPVGELAHGGVRIVPAERLLGVLQGQAHVPGQRRREALVATAERVLRPYLER